MPDNLNTPTATPSSENTHNNDINPVTLTEEIYKQNLALLEQRRRTEQLLDNVSEGVFAVDKDFRITLLNSTLEEQLDSQSDDLLNLHADEVIYLETEKGEPVKVADYCFIPDIDRVNKESLVFKGRNSPDRFVNLRSNIITPSDEKKECLVTLVDVTNEKYLDKVKDDFVAVTSHELRTPMTIIKNNLWMLQNGKEGEMSEKQSNYIQKTYAATERMIKLINDILNISRIQSGKIEIIKEEINVNALLEEIIPEHLESAGLKNLSLKFTPGVLPSNVRGDKDKVREIVTNLVGNAIKYTVSGGVEVFTEATNENTVKISVKDTGEGISKTDLERLFHKFERLENTYTRVAEVGGTGLGLYIVKILVEAMGGKVGVYSEGLNMGSTFWFTLPLAFKKSQRETTVLTDQQSPQTIVGTTN